MGLKFIIKCALISTAIISINAHPIFAQCPSNIQDKSSKITKRIGSFAVDSGTLKYSSSGVVFAKQGSTYYVITTEHGVRQKTDLRISIDSLRPSNLIFIDSNKEYDIAVLSFDLEKDFANVIDVASVSSTDFLAQNEVNDVYVSGYPINLEALQCLPVKRTGIISKSSSAKDIRGPLITYKIESNEKKINGMSGGSVLDRNENLVAIQRAFNPNDLSGELVPLKNYTFLSLPEVVKAALSKSTDTPLNPALTTPSIVSISGTPPIPPSPTPIPSSPTPKSIDSITYWNCERCELSGTGLSSIIGLAAKSDLNNLENVSLAADAKLVTPFLNMSNLSRANLENAYLRNAQLTFADLQGVNLSGSMLDNSVIIRANMNNSSLKGANLRNVNLSNANISNSDLSGANLAGANLVYTNLSGTNLAGANLRHASMYRANLSGADLTGADLYGADLKGADLSNTILKNAQFCRTIMPNGTESKEGC